ncbi:MAG TPA: YlbF family regulator [Verrucomicrobiales bacterium]|nr:YlbF family regulator [Verrucomicrobiales bacterium]
MLIIGADDEVRPRLDLGEKIRELCEALLQDDGVQSARERIERFLQNPDATRNYAKLANLSESLHQKQMQGEEVTEQEAETFESLRDEVMSNPAVQDFAEARGTLQEIEGVIMSYVSRTFEIGRVPSESDIAPRGGSCGSGCGCH